jgi:hypothetical protein
MPGEGAVGCGDVAKDSAKSLLRRKPGGAGNRQVWRHDHRCRERQACDKFGKPLRRQAEPGEGLPFGALGDLHAAPECLHLVEVHQPAWLSLCPAKGSPKPLIV